MPPSKTKVGLAFAMAVLSHFSFSQTSSGLLLKQAEVKASKDPAHAFDYYDDVLLLSKRESNHEVYVQVLNKMFGAVSRMTSEQTLRTFSYLKAAGRAYAKSPENEELGDLYFNLAQFYHFFRGARKDSAEVNYQQALKIRTSVFGPESEPVASVYYHLGDLTLFHFSESVLAEQYYERSLAIRRKLNHVGSLNLALTYYGLAANNRQQGDFEKAISYGLNALENVEKLGDANLLERTYTLVANIYRDVGETSVAKDYYLRAIALNLKTNNTQALAWHHVSLGQTYLLDSASFKAVDSFNKALRIYEKSLVQFKPLWIHCHQRLAEAYSMHGDFQRAYDVYRSLLRQIPSLDIADEKQMAQTLDGLASLFLKFNSYDSALIYFDRALSVAVAGYHSSVKLNEKMIGTKYYVYEILRKKGALLEKMYDKSRDEIRLAESLDCLRLSERLMIRERNTLDMEDSKWSFVDKNHDLYDQLLSVLMKTFDLHRSDSLKAMLFGYMERSKNHTLVTSLMQAERGYGIHRNDSLVIRRNRLKKDIFRIQHQIASSSDRAQIVTLREQLLKKDQEVRDITERIEKRFPGYNSMNTSRAMPALNDVKSVLDRNDQMLIEFYIGEKDIYALAIADSTHIIHMADADSLKAAISSVVNYLNAPQNTLSLSSFQQFASNAFYLYQNLLLPFKDMMRERKRLVIIPDGLLCQLPFEVLMDKQPDLRSVNYLSISYIIQDIDIGYSYTALSLTDAFKEKNTPTSVLAVAVRKDATNRYPHLPGAAVEIEKLKLRFPGEQFLLDGNATETNFKAAASSQSIIHLALHGSGDPLQKFSSKLIFQAAGDSLEDNQLYSYEIYDMNLKANLVVLSSCESGLGKSYRGEGMLSMANAFAFAGCKNVMLNLWKANDQVSSQCLDYFYENAVERAYTLDVALGMAKRTYLRSANELTADPRTWASMVVYGNLASIEETKNKTRAIVLTLLALVVILAVGLKKRKTIAAFLLHRL